MTIDNLRKIFSKGMVSTSDDTVIALYSFKDRWFTQDADESDNKIGCLSELIRESDRIILNIDTGKYIRLCFHGNFGFGDMRIHEIVKPELTTAEIDQFINSMEITDRFGLLETFKDVDFDNKDETDAMIEQIIETMTDELTKYKIPFNNTEKYNAMIDIIKECHGKYLAKVTANPPSKLSHGSFEFDLDSTDSPMVFVGAALDRIKKLVDLSSCVGIEGNVNEGVSVVTFFM